VVIMCNTLEAWERI